MSETRAQQSFVDGRQRLQKTDSIAEQRQRAGQEPTPMEPWQAGLF